MVRRIQRPDIVQAYFVISPFRDFVMRIGGEALVFNNDNVSLLRNR